MSTCRFCQATIRWVQLDSGKPIPVEPIPQPDRGNVAASPQGATLVGHVIAKDKPLRDGQHRYVPHKAACRSDEPRVARPDSLFDDDLPRGDHP